MLEDLFRSRAVIERWKAGVLGPYFDPFLNGFPDRGYTRWTVRNKFQVLSAFQRWLSQRALGVADLDDTAAKGFLDTQTRRGCLRKGESYTIRQFLDYLRGLGVISTPEPILDTSALTVLRRRYEKYLIEERGLAMVTPGKYWRVISRFLAERFGKGAIRPDHLTPHDVSDFLLRYSRHGDRISAKNMVSQLRSFFRFLFLAGESKGNLVGAVPAVAKWRLAGRPKFIEPKEVERVIDTCEQHTAVGCRDRAMLLLMARLGLRAGEVAALEVGDVDWRSGHLKVRGKGHVHDRLPLPADVGKAIATYLRCGRPPCAIRQLFIRDRAPRQGIGSGGVTAVVVRALKRAKLEPGLKGAHLLRHSLATGMLRSGATMGEIGQILRHRYPDSTEIYAKVDVKGLRALARRWPTKGGGQ